MTALIDRALIDSSGGAIGKVIDVIGDPVELTPEWLVVKVGRFAGEHLVPLAAVEDGAGSLVARVEKRVVTSAPKVHEHVAPGAQERKAIYRHYGLTASDGEQPPGSS